MRCIHLTKDLFFSSKVSGFARELEIPMQVVADLSGAGDLSDVKLLLIDLTQAGMDLVAAVSRLKTEAPDARVVAYGPHVNETLLAEAQAAGCDAVLPRSQFDKQVASLLQAAKNA